MTVVLAIIAGPTPVWAAAQEYLGRRLVEVLGEFEDRGLEIVFSSAVVPMDLRITVEPVEADPRAMLEQILLPLGLQARDGPAGSILIVPSRPQTGTLRGRIVSIAGRQPVAGATIRLRPTGGEALSGPGGDFEIPRLPAGRYAVIVEAEGFTTSRFSRIRVRPDRGTDLDIELRGQPAFITQVVVTPNRHSVVPEEHSSRHTVTGDDAVLAPTIGGDVSRVVELLPGVASPNSSAAFHVRGSTARDVSLVLDGLELYDPFHLQSFQSPFSLIDSNVVDRIEFFGGGFTADLGDRHGGFIDISTLAPEDSALGELEIGTLNTRVSYRSPIATGSRSWLVSARAWYPEAVQDTTELGRGENLDPYFGDVYAKVGFNVAPRHRLSAHALLAYDRLTFSETGEEINERVEALTRNGYVWLRALSAWSTGLTSQTTLSGGRIERLRDGIASVNTPVLVDDDRVVDFYGFKHDSTWQIADAHALKTGIEARWLRAEYRYSNNIEGEPTTSPLRLDPDGTSLGVYAAYRTRILPRLATEIGARWDRQTYTNDNQLSPRLNAVWRPGERSEARLALGRFNQSQRIHELHVEDGETEFGRSEVSEQAELSFRHTLQSGVRFRFDAYYRELSDLRARYENLFEPIELFPEAAEDRVRIAPEGARLQGVELLLRGESSRPLFWWVSYTLSSAEDIIDDRDVPRSWDQTHAGRFLVGYRKDGAWFLSLGGSAHRGWPTTPVEAILPEGSTEPVPVLGERNSDRFPGYVRFDLKARRSFSLPRGRIWLTLELLNLTDRKNACCLDILIFEPQPDGTVDTRRQFDHWLGTTASFSVLWEF